MKLRSRVVVLLSAVVALLGAGAVVAASPANALTVGPYQIINYNSGLCMDVLDAATSDGTPIQQWTCNHTNAQYWQIQSDWSGTDFKLEPTNALSRPGCLTNSGWSKSSGTSVSLVGCEPSPWVSSSQSYSLIPGLNTPSPYPTPGPQYRYRFINYYSQMCLQPSGGSTGTGARIVQATCNGSAAQYWIVTY